MITPTVGRIVWFYATSEAEETAAMVVKVWSDCMVNLCCFDGNGCTGPRQSVTLVQPEDERPTGPYCTWMPYQVKKVFGSESGEKGAGTQVI